MLVRLNIGRKVGQIQDIEPSAAKQMLADGRASVPEYDQVSTEPEGVAKPAATADSATEPQSDKTDSAKSAKAAKRK